MRIFVTGASGFIGRAVVEELLGHGYQVLALTRSDASAKALREAGAELHKGDLKDLDSLTSGAKAADGVVHLAFIHDFKDFGDPQVVDRVAVEAMGKALAGSNKPIVIATGTLSLKKGVLGLEDGEIDDSGIFAPRGLTPKLLFAMSKRDGFRATEIRLSPTVHDKEDWGYVPNLMRLARKNGFVAYVGDGLTTWPAVHRRDAALLFRLALEKGADGASYHAVAEQRITMKDIMAVIGTKMGLPTKSLSQDEASQALGFFAHGVSTDNPVSSEWTQRQLGWQPTRVGLLEDIEKNYIEES